MNEPGVNDVLTVGDAIRIIDSVPVLSSPEANRRRPAIQTKLSRDVVADRDYPPFDKALMDGFAVRSAEVATAPSELRVVGEVAAGGEGRIRLGPGECVAIMTGAPVPPDADAVLPVEVAQVAGTHVRFSKAAKPGDAVARRGSDFRRGDLVVREGTPVGPAQVGALVQVGAASLLPSSLFDAPGAGVTAHVLVTGDEIVGEEETPAVRQMRDANGPMLAALLAAGGVKVDRSRIGDNERQTRERIDHLAREHDVLCVTGGMSMGRYDYVPRVMVELGFQMRITKLRIKPGKPFVFATRERPGKTDFVFGLPGNPVSGFCCSVRLVARLIARMQDRRPPDPMPAVLESPLPANGPREFYQPAILESGRVMPLGWKGSADVFTLARSNALIVRPIDDPPRTPGESVAVLTF